jgi:hypothetical protein
MDLFKLILLTPDDEYSANAAYRLFKCYSSQEVDDAFFQLQARAVVSRCKERGLRMRGFKINKKFLDNCRLSILPTDTLVDAFCFWKKITGEQEETAEEETQQPIRKTMERVVDENEEIIRVEVMHFNPICTGGEVAGALSLLTTEKLRIIPELPELTEQERKDAEKEQQEAEKSGGKRARVKTIAFSGVAAHLASIGAADGEKVYN